VRCRTEGGGRGEEGGGKEGGKVGAGRVTSFIGAVVAGVGVGVVEEEGAEDGAAEDEVGVVWVPGLEGWGQRPSTVVAAGGGGTLLAGEDGFGVDGVVDWVVFGGDLFLIGGQGVGHLCCRLSLVKRTAALLWFCSLTFWGSLEAQGRMCGRIDAALGGRLQLPPQSRHLILSS